MTADQQTIRDLVDGIRFAMLTTQDGGRLVSRPMTPLRIEDDLTLLFVTQRDTDVAQQSVAGPLNLAFAENGTFVSISGTAELLDDVELKKDLWSIATEAYTEEGPEDPSNVVLAVHPESASYWESASAPVTVVSMLKAAVTNGKPEAGDHGTVEL